ncbi:MAG: alternative ribosome rescue aminoacyl-tRNA hydrolase ArfB [Planctomycetota bacterium]|nr:alternative ribosome rescue aminoacyl-tRNA hydrolase ArfB [Planctomycetota bacterium]
MEVAPNIRVDESEFKFSFARSGGPGGQNVNKVSSKVILHWDLAAAPGVPEPVKARFRVKFANRLTEAGVLVLDCDETRSQHHNRELVVARLKAMLEQVARPPKKRIPTKPTKAARNRRRASRERDSQKKQLRRKVDY